MRTGLQAGSIACLQADAELCTEIACAAAYALQVAVHPHLHCARLPPTVLHVITLAPSAHRTSCPSAAKALDVFLMQLVQGAADIAQRRGAKMLTASHMWVTSRGVGQAGWMAIVGNWPVEVRFVSHAHLRPTDSGAYAVACCPSCSKAHVESTEVFDFLKVGAAACAARACIVLSSSFAISSCCVRMMRN